MTRFYKPHNVLYFNGKWSYGLGKLKRSLSHDADFFSLPSHKRKKMLAEAVGLMDAGEYVFSGRMGKYIACEKESGRPTWYVVVETTPASMG